MPVTVVKKTANGAALLSNGNLRTPEGRLSYTSIYQPRKMKDAPPEAKAKYQSSILFREGEDLSLLVGEVVRVLTEKFGSQDKWPKKLKNPILDQGDFDGDEYIKGAKMIRCNSTRKPGVVDQQGNQVEDETFVYSGCYGRLTVRAFYYDQAGNKGVSFGLQNVQKTRDGESLGGTATPATDEFDAFGDDPMGGDKNADPLAGLMN